jgi:hypothetical protein
MTTGKKALKAVHLQSRALISIKGADASDFLQGLITNDVERVSSATSIYAALLTPQGKILFEFFIVRSEDGFLIDCVASQRDALIKRLTLYRLRAKVDIATMDNYSVLAVWGEADNETDLTNLSEPGATALIDGAIVTKDPRLSDLGFRAIMASSELERFCADHAVGLISEGHYETWRLEIGVPSETDMGSDRTFALEANFAELNGVDFQKGCYVGQEVTARMKHKTTLRKRLVPVEGESGLPEGEDAVRAGGINIGSLHTVAGNLGIAMIRLDRADAADAAKTPLRIGDVRIEISKKNWLMF